MLKEENDSWVWKEIGIRSRYAHSQGCCKTSVPSSFKFFIAVIAGHPISHDTTLERINSTPRDFLFGTCASLYFILIQCSFFK